MKVSGGEIGGPAAGTAGADIGTAEGNNIMRAIMNAERRTFAGNEGIRELEALKTMVQQLGVFRAAKRS